MKKPASRCCLGLAVILVLALRPSVAKGGDQEGDRLKEMMSRIELRENLDEEKREYFRRITPLLFDYIQSVIPEEKVASLYDGHTLEELRTLIPRTTGEDLIGFGEKMFAFYEAKAAEVKNVDLGQWSSFPSEHFVFFAHAGSAAAGEMDFVRKVAEETYVEIVRSLDIEQEVENRLPFVSTEVQIKGKKEEGAESHPGKIAVFLHHLRSEASAKKIGKHSMGSMTFGAKILHSEDEKGQGRLKVQIDILYFNALSVIVLSHEIAHAALFLGSFNTEPLVRNPLKGYFALRKAFSAGYLSISPFLQEGIGDYVIYFRGFYRNWPLLPEPEVLIQSLQKSGRYIPLRKIITGGFPAYQRKRKECSLEAASFINFLMREFGAAKLKAWFLSGKKETSKAFEKIFEMTPEQMEKKWLDSIQPIGRLSGKICIKYSMLSINLHYS